LKGDLKKYKAVIIDEILDSIEDKKVLDLFNNSVKQLINEGVEVIHTSISIDLLKTILPTYLLLSCSEASSNNANLDGIKFGPRKKGKTPQEAMINTRTAYFGLNVKKRFILGSYALLKENQTEMYLKACKVRRLIVDAFTKALSLGDYILLPAAPSVAPKFDYIEKDLHSNRVLIAENYLGFANFSGQPSITIPLGFIDGLPLGINITTALFSEDKMFDIAYGLETFFNTKNLYKEGY